MRRTLALGIGLAMCLAATVTLADEFSLFGARFGMSREELGRVWTPLESGEYHVGDSLLFEVRPEFDHEDRFYRVGFSLPLPEEFPAALTASAIQQLVTRRWGRDPDLSVGIRVGKGSARVTVTRKDRLDAYTAHIEARLARLLSP